MPLDPEMLAAGIERHRSGDIQQARAIYRQLLATNPQSAEVYNLLGAASIDAGQFDQAGEYLATALRINPQLAAAHDNLGLCLLAQQKPEDAAASFGRAVALDPRNAQTHCNLANALWHTGASSAAIEAWRQATNIAPEFARAHFELAGALAHAGQTAAAIAAYQEVLRLRPDVPEAAMNLARLYGESQAFAEAVRWWQRTVELRPTWAEAHHRLGCALLRNGQPAEAVASLRAAVTLEPRLADAHNNLGVALTEAGQVAAAIEHYQRAVALSATNREAFYNLANAHLSQGDVPAALEHYDRAITLWPDYVEARHNRAAIWLLEGRLTEGFRDYELRLRSRDYPAARWPWPLWQGEPLAGRTLVLCPEQGIGDTLQFIRYAPLLKRQGARVVVLCSAAQQAILSRTPGVDALAAVESPLPMADFYVPVMSLPERLGTTLETIPAEVPYVFADPEYVELWRQRLSEWDGFKVGIVWQGNPRRPGDRLRSIPLTHYRPLASVGGVRLVSLQKGPGAEQLVDVAKSWPVVDLGEGVDGAGAFVDTAAIMQNLDLVITSDTAPAHLAGALGVATWTALQRVPDWRFLLDREDSPWYPTMRLFRQKIAGDWDGVFEQIAHELERLVARTHTG